MAEATALPGREGSSISGPRERGAWHLSDVIARLLEAEALHHPVRERGTVRTRKGQCPGKSGPKFRDEELAKSAPRPKEARLHGCNRDPEGFGGFLAAHALDVPHHEDAPELVGESADRMLEKGADLRPCESSVG